MCGIVGILLRDPEFDVDLDGILDTLLLHNEVRGGDATGFVAISDDGVAEWQKASCTADTFVAHRRRVPLDAKVVLGHTRYATQGLSSFMENNHPIRRGPYFIVHNGHVSNDDALFVNAARNRFGQVDSESIAARLASLAGLEKLGSVMEEISGSAAVAAVDERDCRRLVLAKGKSSPLYVYNGRRIVIFSSIEKAIVHAHAEYVGQISKTNLFSLEEGDQLEWKNGTLIRSSFEVPKAPERVTYSWSNYDRFDYDKFFRDDKKSLPPGALLDDHNDLDCENCSIGISFKETEYRYDEESGVTFYFCPECADDYDYELEEAEWEEAKAELVDDDGSPAFLDDYNAANQSILRKWISF